VLVLVLSAIKGGPADRAGMTTGGVLLVTCYKASNADEQLCCLRQSGMGAALSSALCSPVSGRLRKQHMPPLALKHIEASKLTCALLLLLLLLLLLQVTR
jgi:hypothetical protein